MYKNNWKLVAETLGNRTPAQCSSHYQSYQKKQAALNENSEKIQNVRKIEIMKD